MTKTDAAPAAGADTSAPDAEKTEEQLWAELEAEEAAREPGKKDDEEQERLPGDPPPADREAGSDDHEDPNLPEEPDKDDDGEAPDGRQSDETREEQIQRLEHALNSERGRRRADRREIENLQRQLAAAQEAQRTENEDQTLKQQREDRQRKLDEAREEYGDLIGPIADHISDLESRLDRLSAQEAKDLERQRERYDALIAEQNEVFTTEHPDGFETIVQNRAAFDAWIEDQPKALRDIYAANEAEIVDGNGAAYLVSLFKDALSDADGRPAPDRNDRLQARRQRQLNGARSTRSRTRQRGSSAPPDDAPPEEHWEYFERMDREGRL